MTRADDLRADLVEKINAYLIDNVDPGLARQENAGLLEAGDIVDLVLQAAYERTMADFAEVVDAMHHAQFAARRPDGSLAYEPEPAEQTWWETWPATALVHAQERAASMDCGACGGDGGPSLAQQCLECHGSGKMPDPAYEASDPTTENAEPPICVCDAPDLYCEMHDA